MTTGDFEGYVSDELSRIRAGLNLRRPSDHQSMFKFISLANETSWDHLHRTLHGTELTGTLAGKLNDPFEQLPIIFDDLHPSTIADSIRYMQSPLDDLDVLPLKDVFPHVDPYRDQARAFLDGVAQRFRIVSFCERSDSALLWSHYANSFQGACLQFLAKGFHWTGSGTLGYVTYSKYRPTYPLSLALALSSHPGGPPVPVNATPMRRAESEKLLFFTKAEDWSYEAEMRLVHDSKMAPKVRFKPDGLVAIIVGPRMPAADRGRLKEMIEASPYSDLTIREASLSATTFSVEIGPGPR